MRPRADDPSLDRVRTGTPQSTAARSVVGPAFKGLLAFFADLLGSDPSLDFGVGYVGWEVAGEPRAGETLGGGVSGVVNRVQKGGLRGVSRALAG